MLFRKKLPRSCRYCKCGTQITDEQVLCNKRGAVATDNACRRFSYDPCKRIPAKAKAIDFSKYNEEEFKL